MTRHHSLGADTGVLAGSPAGSQHGKATRYNGYYQRETPQADAELTHTGPGTPVGELMRRFWQPVCLSQQLGDLPLALRILGEDLVIFRDKSGQVGLLHRHCAHRGTSLEFGIVSEHGIRCCYHGWLFDVDGTVLETPGEPPNSRLKESVMQGAFAAREDRGIVFAYLGPPETMPPFPEVESYGTPPEDCVPFLIPEPCNWLQVHENNMDPMHAPFLHGNVSGVQLTSAFGVIPCLDYVETNGGTSMHYISVRRTALERIWIRFQEAALPNYTDIGSPVEEGQNAKPFQRPMWSRWTVPNDDHNCMMIGWRYYRPDIDEELADRSKVGVNTIDAGGFQDLDDRPYEEIQRQPGDWIAQVSQGPIAIHAREHLGSSDAGISMWRRLVRSAVRGENPNVTPPGVNGSGARIWTYAGDSVLAIPRRREEDELPFLRDVGKRVSDIVMTHGAYQGDETDQSLRESLLALEASLQN